LLAYFAHVGSKYTLYRTDSSYSFMSTFHSFNIFYDACNAFSILIYLSFSFYRESSYSDYFNFILSNEKLLNIYFINASSYFWECYYSARYIFFCKGFKPLVGGSLKSLLWLLSNGETSGGFWFWSSIL